MEYPHRLKRKITYHGRSGYPVVHIDSKTLKRYIMVRNKDRGTKRLYEGTKHRENGKIKELRLD